MKRAALAVGLALGAGVVGAAGWLVASKSGGDGRARPAETGSTAAPSPVPDGTPRPVPALTATADRPAPATSPAARPAAEAPPPPSPAPSEVRNVTPVGVTPSPTVTGPLERLPPKETPKKPEAPPKSRIFRVAVVDDAATLRAGELVITLPDIVVLPASETCRDATGRDWNCGMQAVLALRGLIRARGVRCTLPADARAGAYTSACALGETDLAAWLVRRGWARPKPGADRLKPHEESARAEKIGLWQEVVPVREPLPEPAPPAVDPIEPARRIGAGGTAAARAPARPADPVRPRP